MPTKWPWLDGSSIGSNRMVGSRDRGPQCSDYLGGDRPEPTSRRRLGRCPPLGPCRAGRCSDSALDRGSYPTVPMGRRWPSRVAIDKAIAHISIQASDASSGRWVPAGKFTLSEIAGPADRLAETIAEGVLGRLVRVELMRGSHANGRNVPDRLRIVNASPLILHGLAVAGSKIEATDAPGAAEYRWPWPLGGQRSLLSLRGWSSGSTSGRASTPRPPTSAGSESSGPNYPIDRQKGIRRCLESPGAPRFPDSSCSEASRCPASRPSPTTLLHR